MEAGMLMTEDVTRFSAGTPSETYALRTAPEMVENPSEPLSMTTPLTSYWRLPDVITR